jgi:diaminohydroxyphosphoribosylaminopyrimidine deaminase/5-amino-6-(5-phosphoribosylamino)uracil reductase
MARALRLARRGQYSTPPNPSVGCVLLDARGAVVGEGWHERTGEPHAEVVALRAAQGSARGGTAYVTLEPCSHHGRTPPCADALIDAGVRRVVVATSDPNPRVAGRGVELLEAAGVATSVGLLERESRELNRGFVARMTRGRPWVTVKMGASLDGRTALASGASRWITGEAARADVQRLRARASAILTGVDTVLADDPSLNVRDAGLDLRGRQPLRVVFDTHGRVPARARLLHDGQATLLFTDATVMDEVLARCASVSSAATVTPLPTLAGRLRLDAALQELAARECNEVLVEAGPRLAGAFVAAGLADEIVVYVAATILGDTSRAMFELPEPLRSLTERRVYAFHDVRKVGEDLRLALRPREG